MKVLMQRSWVARGVVAAVIAGAASFLISMAVPDAWREAVLMVSPPAGVLFGIAFEGVTRGC